MRKQPWIQACTYKNNEAYFLRDAICECAINFTDGEDSIPEDQWVYEKGGDKWGITLWNDGGLQVCGIREENSGYCSFE